jgi:hypothetical protein
MRGLTLTGSAALWLVCFVCGCTSETPTESSTEGGDESQGDTADDAGSETSTESGGAQCGVECDPFDPACEADEKCTAIQCEGVPMTVCRLAGTAEAGEACRFVEDGRDECGPGLTCWNLDFETFSGRCVPWCGGTAEAPTCPGNLRCDVFDDGLVPLCFTECHPLEQDCADPSMACFPDFDPKLGATCAPPGTALPAESCAFAGNCIAGSWCAPAEVVSGCGPTLSCCTPLCDIDGPNDCPGASEGETCMPLWDPMTPGSGWESIGLCRLP